MATTVLEKDHGYDKLTRSARVSQLKHLGNVCRDCGYS